MREGCFGRQADGWSAGAGGRVGVCAVDADVYGVVVRVDEAGRGGIGLVDVLYEAICRIGILFERALGEATRRRMLVYLIRVMSNKRCCCFWDDTLQKLILKGTHCEEVEAAEEVRVVAIESLTVNSCCRGKGQAHYCCGEQYRSIHVGRRSE